MEILIRAHAGLMFIAFGLMVSGFLVARLCRKKNWWLGLHRRLGLAGASAMVLGLAAVVFDVVLTGREHLAVPHARLGLVVVALGILTPLLGLVQLKLGGRAPLIRPFHRSAGRLVLTLAAANIVVGLTAAGLI
jgi:hypothetical protein